MNGQTLLDNKGLIVMRTKLTGSRAVFWLLVACLIATSISCADEAESNGAQRISARGDFAPNSVFYTVKDGAPYILINVGPERAKIRGLDAVHQEEYLLRRALVNLATVCLGRPEFQGHSHFVLQMVLIDRDEYGEGAWGSGAEVALLEADRAAIESIASVDIDSLSLERARALFSARQITLTALAGGK